MLSRQIVFGFALIILLYLLINGYQYYQEGVRMIGDSQRYLDAAVAIDRGEAIQGKAGAYPGYNAFIWLHKEFFGFSLSTIVLLQVLCGGFALYFFFWLGKKSDYGNGVIVLGLLFLVLFPDLMIWNSYILTDALYTWLLLITIFLLVKARERKILWILLAVVFSIYTALIRPTGWVFLPVALGWLAWMTPRENWQKIMCSILAFVVIGLLLIWKRGGDDFVAQESLNDHLLRGTVLWNYQPWYLDMPQDDVLSDYTMSGILKYTFRYPVEMVKLMGARALSFFLPIRPYFSTLHNLFLVIYLIPLYLLIALGFGRICRTAIGRLIVIIVLAHVCLTMVTFNVQDNRWFIHVFPLLVYLSLAGLEKLQKNLNYKKVR